MNGVWDFLKDNAFTGMIVGVVGALAGLVGVKLQKAPTVIDTQQAVNLAVEGVLEQYRKLAADMWVDMTALRTEIVDLRRQVDDYAAKLEVAENEIQDMDMHIGELTTLMMSHGITPPQRRRRGNVG